MKRAHDGTDVARLLTTVAANRPLPLQDDGIRYASQGCVLIIGPAALIVPAAQKLALATRVVACSMDNLPAGSAHANPLFIPCRILSVHGHLGNFKVKAQDPAQNPLDLSLFSPKPDGGFDLVLDLSATPHLSMPIKPPGYFSPEPEHIDAAIAQLLALKGNFRKSRFFHFNAELCAHGAQGIKGCTRCLSRCPAEAITSANDRIAVNAHLCQGCSTCMLICPTGALSHASLTPAAMLMALADKWCPGIERLCIHEANEPLVDDPAVARLAIPAIAAAGPEIWFSALAIGFPQVLIQLPEELPDLTRDTFIQQLKLAHALLVAIGQPVERIVSTYRPASQPRMSEYPVTPLPATTYAGKRAQLLWALEALQNEPAEGGYVELTTDADMGGIKLDPAICTLCMACTQLCPTGALVSESGQTRLDFVEDRCVQCQICVRACPEQAISVVPRFLWAAPGSRASVTLKQDEQHCCPQCGVPFISPALLATGIRIMLQQADLDHAGVENLRLCPSCRLHRLREPSVAD